MKLFFKLNYVSVEDSNYTKNQFEKWARHSLRFWYEVEEPININNNMKYIEQEISSLEELVKANSLDEWLEL